LENMSRAGGKGIGRGQSVGGLWRVWGVSVIRFQQSKNFKQQNTNTKQITMTEFQNSKQLVFDFIW